MSTFEVVVIGGGHNGLAAAAYLAKAGRRVCLLERNGALGGRAAESEFHPGYRVPGLLHDTSWLRPQVVEELGLELHGLELREPAPLFAPQRDGDGVLLHHDAQQAAAELARHSLADVESYIDYREWFDGIGPTLRRILDRTPPALELDSVGGLWGLLGAGVALRRLGRQDLSELARMAPMCVADWLRERFESDLLQALLAAPAVSGGFVGPWSPGTAAHLLWEECLRGREVAGGPAALVAALQAACVSAGVELRSGVEVRAVRVADGRVEGVEAVGGETIFAPLVLATCDPRVTFLELLQPHELPAGFAAEMRRYRGRGTTAKLNLALSGPLEFACRPRQPVEAARIGEHLDDLERAFDAAKYRELPARPHLDLRVPSVARPDLAPAGHHVVSLLVHFAAHDLEGGWSAEAKQRLTDAAVAELARYAPGVESRIVGHQLLSPADLEQRLRLPRGHIHHGEMALDQLGPLRPVRACAAYTTPLPGLFLGGSGSHPGGGISCGPGRLAAAAAIRAGRSRAAVSG